jgi:hypothetical protein
VSGPPRRTIVLPLRAGLLGLALAAAPTAAQVPDTAGTPVDSVVVTPAAEPTLVDAAPDSVRPVSPRGAFLRSMVLPGWGQATFDANFRGGIYFAGWAANWFMIFRNQVRLDAARSRYDRRVDQIETALIASSENPDSLRAAMEEDPRILDTAVREDTGLGSTGNNLRKLVNAREQQREDWIAWSIFWVLASGIDGYVTAHLSDFPTSIDFRQNPDRSLSVELRVPIGPPRP